jgi:AcrR family transcriptional regulator
MSGPRDQFARARHPQEKAARREAILAAARDLVDHQQIHEVSLNAIALATGLTKPNLYRYFESREEILLTLFLEDLRGFTEEVVTRLGPLGPADDEVETAVAAVLVDAYAARPRLCRFLGMIASVFEHNVSVEAIEETKRISMALAQEVSSALHRLLARLTLERCLWLNNAIALFVAGLWPPAHPAPAVRAVLAKPQFASLGPNFERDLKDVILTLIRGS